MIVLQIVSLAGMVLLPVVPAVARPRGYRGRHRTGLVARVRRALK